MRVYVGILVILLLVSLAVVASVRAAGSPVSETVQTCRGPANFVSRGQTFSLTCNVTSPLGGSQMLILPEMWVPGNGCIVTVDKPRVIMVGNNFGVRATFTNRCAGAQTGSQGGLAWLIIQIGP